MEDSEILFLLNGIVHAPRVFILLFYLSLCHFLVASVGLPAICWVTDEVTDGFLSVTL